MVNINKSLGGSKMINIKERNEKIVSELIAGATLKEVAIDYKLSIGRVKYIYDKYKGLMKELSHPEYAELYRLLNGHTRSLTGLKRIGVTDVETLTLMYKYDTELKLLLHGARSLGVKSVAYIRDCLKDIQVNTTVNRLQLTEYFNTDILDMNRFYVFMYNNLADNGFANLFADISKTVNGRVINHEYTIVGKIVDFDFLKWTVDVVLLVPETYDTNILTNDICVNIVTDNCTDGAFDRMTVRFVIDTNNSPIGNNNVTKCRQLYVQNLVL
jgi:hypothetical protein